MRRLTLAALAAAAAVAASAALALAFAASSAHAVSPDVVVSQVYGGGGNGGATLTNDYIELYNRGGSAVALSGWSVQYASATGSSWQVTALSGSIAPGARYLVAEAAGAGGTTPLPAPNATGSIAMSATAGKVALVTNATALTAVCAATCHAGAGVRDYIGYGTTATDFEGSGPAPTLSNTTAALRDGGGTVDTDDSAADFTAGTPAPAGAGEPPPPPPGVPARIRDIQGAAHVSPLVGRRVIEVPGVVTAVAANRFFMQDPHPDGDPQTSEAIIVFTSSAPAVAVGDAVTVAGGVEEFRPGGATNANLATTEIAGSPAVVVESSGNPLPVATLVGPGGRVPPGNVIDDDATGSVETSGTFDAATDGIDFWESVEAMRVRIDEPRVVGPTNRFGETAVVPAGAQPRTARGGIVISPLDFNPERIVLADTFATVPAADVGARYAGAVTGVTEYNFGLFTLLPSTSPQVRDGGLRPETTRRQRGNELAAATFNVENLSPLDPPRKYATLARQIIGNLAAPDLVALEEIQDNTGPANDGVVAADQTLELLVAAIRAAGGPRYHWRQIDPADGADGGQPGGNIRQAFVFRTDRGLRFVDRPGGDATTPVAVVAQNRRAPQLSVSPGRIDPANPVWANSRKPLAGEFRWRGERIFAVANHFNSKGGDQPLFGRFQPPARPSEVQRRGQATAVRAFADALLAEDRHARIVVLGDINDFEFSDVANILVGTDRSLVDLPRTLPARERYTYVFEGNSQVLDHILISRALADGPGRRAGYEYDIVHANSEFSEQVSDHDPQVVRLRR
jgi:predicted extracellular nuclease